MRGENREVMGGRRGGGRRIEVPLSLVSGGKKEESREAVGEEEERV